MSAQLPEHSMAERLIPAPRYLGYEFYYPPSDPLVEWAAAHIETLRPEGGNRPLSIEVGGASGFRAMSLARQGCDVKIIDRVCARDIIKARNEWLARENASGGKIDLHVADLREMKPHELKKICGKRLPKIVTALQFIHFLKRKELSEFFELFSGVSAPGTLLGLSYCRLSRLAKDNKNLIYYRPERVADMARKSAFSLLREFPELPTQYGLTRQVFRLDS
jgi:hypothetical protein